MRFWIGDWVGSEDNYIMFFVFEGLRVFLLGFYVVIFMVIVFEIKLKLVLIIVDKLFDKVVGGFGFKYCLV